MSSDITQKVWGSERLLRNEEFCAKVMTLNQGAQCSIHFHKIKKEMFIVTKGKILVELWNQFPMGKIFADDGVLRSPEECGIDLSKPDKILILGDTMPLRVFRRGIEMYPRPYNYVFIDNYVPHRFTGLDAENLFIETSTKDYADDSYRFISSRKPDNR